MPLPDKNGKCPECPVCPKAVKAQPTFEPPNVATGRTVLDPSILYVRRAGTLPQRSEIVVDGVRMGEERWDLGPIALMPGTHAIELHIWQNVYETTTKLRSHQTQENVTEYESGSVSSSAEPPIMIDVQPRSRIAVEVTEHSARVAAVTHLDVLSREEWDALNARGWAPIGSARPPVTPAIYAASRPPPSPATGLNKMNARTKVLTRRYRGATGAGPDTVNTITIRGLPEDWQVFAADGPNNTVPPDSPNLAAAALDSSTGVGPTREGLVWRWTKADPSQLAFVLMSADKSQTKFVAAAPLPVDVTFGDLSASSVAETPVGSIIFASAGAWAKGKRLIVTNSTTPAPNSPFTIGTDGGVVISVPPGEWNVGVEGDPRTPTAVTVPVMNDAKDNAVHVTWEAPSASSSTDATITVSGVRDGETIRVSPDSIQFSQVPPYTATIVNPTAGQLVHITVVRPDGQNETKTVSLSTSTHIVLPFVSPPPKPTAGPNYLLWGAVGVGVLGAGYAAWAAYAKKGQRSSGRSSGQD